MPQVPSAAGDVTPPGVTPTGAYVLCRTGAGQPLRFRLGSTAVVAGSDAGLAIPLPLPGVSRRHLKFVFEGASWWVVDLDSSNGTFVNGRLVTRDRIRHLDVVGVGRSVDLLFLQRDEAPAALRRGITHAAIVAERGPDPVRPIDVGEVTLGRSSACTIQVEGAAVSKVHARLERTTQQLTLRDLGSANGTWVNGQQVSVVALKDGDVFSLGEMVRFRVVLEFGEVKTLTGARPIVEVPEAEEAPALSMDWKTRYEWDDAEMKQIAELQQQLRARHEEKKAPRRDTVKAMPPVKVAPAKAASPPASAPKPPATAPAAPNVAPKPEAPKPEAPKPEAPKPEAPRPVAPPAAGDEPPATILPGRLVAAPVVPPVKRVVLVGATEQLSVDGEGRFLVGRGTDAPLRPQHPTVSRKHAWIVVVGTAVTLEDLGSRSGTLLNDQPVTGTVALKPGDKLVFGEARYEVRIET